VTPQSPHPIICTWQHEAGHAGSSEHTYELRHTLFLNKPYYKCKMCGYAKHNLDCPHSYIMQVTEAQTELENRCIHCGHTKPLPRKDDKVSNNFKDYPYIVLCKNKEGGGREYLNGFLTEEAAIDEMKFHEKSNGNKIYAVAKIRCETKQKETIVDQDDKTYIIDRGSISTKITAPCGQSQTFSNSELRKLLKGE